MERVARSQDELNEQLDEQLEFLKTNLAHFDAGNRSYAKLIAANLRVLLHDGGSRTKSLLGQLGLKSRPFINTAETPPTAGPNVIVTSFSALVGVSGNSFVPHFDDVPGGSHISSFDDWWNEIVHKDQDGNTFSRKEVVLYLAEQDGGVHVDAELDKKYRSLSRENSLGWLSDDGNGWMPISNPEAMSVRQIAHEVLRTLEVPYNFLKPASNSPLTISGSGITVHTVPTNDLGQPIRRKEPCYCGSGKKYKRCHGK